MCNTTGTGPALAFESVVMCSHCGIDRPYTSYNICLGILKQYNFLRRNNASFCFLFLNKAQKKKNQNS